jgi:two-component sensor histidine kinase
MRLSKSGVIVPVSITVSPIFDAAGNIIGASKIARSISDRLKSEETRRVLMREVAHRSKNMLAIVEAIVRQTAKRSPPADFAERLSMRLRSIAASQDLLVSSEWSGVEIGALVGNQLSRRLVGSSIHVDGPALVLKPAAAQTLGMALHELLTNAQQFGSLSIAGGHVDLSWALIEEGALFEMKWVEVGGPAITEKPTAGFGQTVLRRITEGSLDGKVQHVYAPSGVQWTVRAPTDMVLA